MKDILDRADIEKLVNAFYVKVKGDGLIAPFFMEVAHVNWEKHLPIMYDFWENVLFHNGDYAGNPMKQHKILSAKMPITSIHFSRWIQLFNETVDELFEGKNSFIIKQRAFNIAGIMQGSIHN